jgi:hypothetical protein
MGFDVDQQDTRNFMLRRIVSKIKSVKTNAQFTPPTREQIAEAIAD